jgi:NDP-sugar pyrophosphorylase family protein
MLDWALDGVDGITDHIAVTINSQFHGARIRAHLSGRSIHISEEQGAPIGAIGALSLLRPWIAERDVLLVSADSWFRSSLGPFVDEWQRRIPRLWVVDRAPYMGDVGTHYFVGVSLIPGHYVARLPSTPGDLLAARLLPDWRDGAVDVVVREEPWIECGTPKGYLMANMLWSGGKSVIGPGARVLGEVERCIVWPGGTVEADERLFECLRIGRHITIEMR